MVFTIKERIFTVQEYFTTKSLECVREQFSDEFPKKSAPDMKSILHLVEKFKKHGTVWNLPHERTKTVLTPQTSAPLEEKLMVNSDPLTESLCHEAREDQLPYGTSHHRIVVLNLHLYRVRAIREL